MFRGVSSRASRRFTASAPGVREALGRAVCGLPLIGALGCGAGADPVAPPSVAAPRPTPVLPSPAPTDPVRARLEDAGRISWISVASIVGAGTQHCIDGRAPGPVVGTPGGDAGELTLALSAVEHTARAEVPLTAVAGLVAAYAESFGRFHLHTDQEALVRLEQAIAADPALAEARGGDDIATFVAHPPAAHGDSLASLLARPDLVGCGHLRLLLEHPEEYGVRRELAEAVIRETHHLRWQRPELVDFDVLEGVHEERAVVRVFLDRPVHGDSRVPTFPAREGDTASFFVSHPEVSAYLRSELGSFLAEHESSLSRVSGSRARRRPLAREALDHELAALADRQIHATLRHLARELPVYEVHLRPESERDGALTVSGPNASLGCASY